MKHSGKVDSQTKRTCETSRNSLSLIEPTSKRLPQTDKIYPRFPINNFSVSFDMVKSKLIKKHQFLKGIKFTGTTTEQSRRMQKRKKKSRNTNKYKEFKNWTSLLKHSNYEKKMIARLLLYMYNKILKKKKNVTLLFVCFNIWKVEDVFENLEMREISASFGNFVALIFIYLPKIVSRTLFFIFHKYERNYCWLCNPIRAKCRKRLI